MIKAARVYGTDNKGRPLIKLHWMGYIDCFVPFNRQSSERLAKFIMKINPDIIFGPDPSYYYDAHRDHMATAKMYRAALKLIPPAKRPKIMLYYATVCPDFFIRNKNYGDRKIFDKLLLAHRSQFVAPLIILGKVLKYILYWPYYIKRSHLHGISCFRRVTPEHRRIIPARKKCRWGWFVYRFITHDFAFGGDDDLLHPTPEELGLNTEPEGDII